MNILLMLAHAIEEHDQIKLLSEIGYDVFSLGGYIDPANPHDPKRPPLPDAPFHPELKAVVDALGQRDNLEAARRHIPDDILDWADVIIVHHLEHTWLAPQWNRIRHKRVIWRTVGQSAEGNEAMMAPLHRQGLEIVRYSPKEVNIPNYAGSDALIRFYKDPDEWSGWTGEAPVVLNIAQHDAQPHGRDVWLNWRFWEQATEGLPAVFAGPHSELMGGHGELSYEAMKSHLRTARCYLYTGTQPASYTLGLIEAMMTGIPVVSIGPEHMQIFPYGADIFEGREIALRGSDDPKRARDILANLLAHPDPNPPERQRAIELFGKDTIAAQWRDYLGAPVETREKAAVA
jgi:hypothetical protein